MNRIPRLLLSEVRQVLDFNLQLATCNTSSLNLITSNPQRGLVWNQLDIIREYRPDQRRTKKPANISWQTISENL